MSRDPTTLHEAAIDLVQGLMALPGCVDAATYIIRSGRTTMASLSLHDSGIRTLEAPDLADTMRLLAMVVERIDAPFAPAIIPDLTRLASTITATLKGGAR